MPATKARRRRKSSAPASANGAKRKVNASEAVRKYLRKNRDAKPKQISDALAKRGIVVKPTYVSIIKSKFLAAGGASGAGSRKRKANSARYDISDLMEAKKFAESIGGVDRAKEVIGAIAKLQ